MKTKFYYFAIILMANFSFYFGQSYTLTLNNELKETDKVPRYNLYYLSKLLAYKNSSLEEKNKTFYALQSLVGDKSLDKKNIDKEKFKNIYNFVENREEEYRLQFEDWFDKNTTTNFISYLKQNQKSLLDTLLIIEKIKKNYDSQNAKIKKIQKSISDLKEEYSQSHYNKLKEEIILGEDISNVLDKYYDINCKIDNIELFKQKLHNKYGDLKKIEIDNLKEKYSNDDFNNLSSFLRQEVVFNYFKDEDNNYYFRNLKTLKKEIESNVNLSKLLTDNKNNENKLAKEIDNFITAYLKVFLKKNSDINSIDLKKVLNTNNFRVSTPQQIIINSQIQTAQAQTGASGISIPSQSQMIEAMAIFLAKRAKQEAAIWFMDQIRLKMNNPLVFDVFPETIKVLDGVENYKVPTFNTTWKYAIAKDFVEMPKNVVNSPWVESVIIKNPTNHAMLKQSINFGYDINRLMTEQYNYRDIIKYLYINPRTEKEKVEKDKNKDKADQEVNRLIDNSTTLLYIITNELFAIENIDGKDFYRLLSYEEISSLSKEEYDVLLELIYLKYEARLNNYEIIKNLKSANKEEVNKWIGNILISLSQFDKIRGDFQTKKEEIKEDISSKKFYNVWSLLNQVTENINNCAFFDAKDEKKELRQKIKTQIKYVQTGMSVYEHFQSNNYVGAANQTFELVNLIKLNTPNDSQYNIKLRKTQELISEQLIQNNYINLTQHFYDLIKIKNGNQSYTYNEYFYSFGKKAKIFLTPLDGTTKFKITNKDSHKYIIIYFKGNDLVFEDSHSNFLTLNDYQMIGKYFSGNINAKRLKEVYDNNMHSSIDEILKLSEALNLDQSELLKIINYTYVIKQASSEGKNLDEVLKNLKFTLATTGYLTLKNNQDKYTKQLTNLLSFFGDVLTVKDEHQLAGVIDSYALPPTSYKLKRKQPSSIDLNAYVGAFGGGLMSLKSSTIGSQAVYGITAPIGVAFTWSRDGWYDNYGFTIDVVDLGNVVNHYLVKPGEEYAKDVHFSEVFSLGTTFLMGIKNSPFVISGGFRLQPFNTGKDANNKLFDAGIFHLGLKIDIPLIHLSGKNF